MKRGSLLLLLLFLPLLGCGSTHSPIPLASGPPAEPLSSTVLAGHARAWRFTKGSWVEAPAYDYEFLVLERRYEGRWDVVKEIHRRDPRYDGRAGPRDQTIFFAVHTSPAAGGGLDLAVQSTLGSGTGHVDAGGDGFVVEMAAAQKGMFVPFDTVRIRQLPSREGHLEETVELYSKKDGVERPFMKMEEQGLVYRPVAGK
jgi:hypothetical protein